jgi:hypothetical protein
MEMSDFVTGFIMLVERYLAELTLTEPKLSSSSDLGRMGI